jgi:hypothetical protein
VKLASLLKRGLPLTISCSKRCKVQISVVLDARSARLAHLSRTKKRRAQRPVVIARLAKTVEAGHSLSIRLRPTARNAKAMRRLRSIKLTASGTANDGVTTSQLRSRQLKIVR